VAAALRALSIVSASTRWPSPCSAYSHHTRWGCLIRFFRTVREETSAGGEGERERTTLMTPFRLHTRCVDFVTPKLWFISCFAASKSAFIRTGLGRLTRDTGVDPVVMSVPRARARAPARQGSSVHYAVGRNGSF